MINIFKRKLDNKIVVQIDKHFSWLKQGEPKRIGTDTNWGGYKLFGLEIITRAFPKEK